MESKTKVQNCQCSYYYWTGSRPKGAQSSKDNFSLREVQVGKNRSLSLLIRTSRAHINIILAWALATVCEGWIWMTGFNKSKFYTARGEEKRDQLQKLWIETYWNADSVEEIKSIEGFERSDEFYPRHNHCFPSIFYSMLEASKKSSSKKMVVKSILIKRGVDSKCKNK